MDVICVRENGAYPGEKDDPEPVETCFHKQRGVSAGIEQGQGEETDEADSDQDDCLPDARPDFVFPNKGSPCEGSERCQNRSP